jgi:uncharacterized protein (TIGR02147 family)
MTKAHTLLKRNFDRQKRTHGLTLRELASRTRVSPGFLSKVFSGKKNLSAGLAESLCNKLNVDELQREQVFEQLKFGLIKEKFGRTKPHIPKTNIIEPLSEFHLMGPDAEWLLEKWYRLAILDIVTCVDFQEQPMWVANRLSISTPDADRGLKDLEKFGLLHRDEAGRLRKKHELLRFPTKFSKSIVRHYQAAQLKRATENLLRKTDQRSFDARLITTISVASDPKNISRAKRILHEALYEAAVVLSKGEPTEVYQISLQLFPQTKLVHA